jgi:hypothetical protein
MQGARLTLFVKRALLSQYRIDIAFGVKTNSKHCQTTVMVAALKSAMSESTDRGISVFELHWGKSETWLTNVVIA